MIGRTGIEHWYFLTGKTVTQIGYNGKRAGVVGIVSHRGSSRVGVRWEGYQFRDDLDYYSLRKSGRWVKVGERDEENCSFHNLIEFSEEEGR